jgi:hypothetical protein
VIPASFPSEQVLGDDRVGGLPEDRLPLPEIQVAHRGRHDPQSTRLLHLGTHDEPHFLRREHERVDDEHPLAVVLGDGVHVRVGAALHEERVRLVVDSLQADEQVVHKLDPSARETPVREALKLQVGIQRVLVARAGWAEGDEGGR